MVLDKYKKIVIKIGSSLVADQDSSLLRANWLASMAKDIADLRKRGKEVLIVSSGAVALGRKFIQNNQKPLTLEEKQAAAACGQTQLIEAYGKFFTKHKIKVAQILMTISDTESRRNYLNAKNTIETLLANKIIPIINENDTVATSELRFGDNDRLAARVAQMVSSDLLILFSDVDGLYSGNPKLDKNAKLLHQINEINDDIEKMATGPLSRSGSGGMITKIQAGKIVVSSGCNMIIANGLVNNPVKNIETRKIFSLFQSEENPLSARKNWIAHNLNAKGEVIIDDGALRAIINGKSLLPAGVVDIKGKFGCGDTVIIKDCRLKFVGKGICAYSSEDSKMIMGHQSHEIENLIGFSGRHELIHSNDLVITNVDKYEKQK